jgi:hypothetical protein
VIGIVPFPGSRRRAVTRTYRDEQWITATAGAYSFTGLSFGAASAGRYMVACIGWTDFTIGNALSSVTIGGVSATILGQSGVNLQMSICIAFVPTGTTGTVVANFTGSAARCNVHVYSLDGPSTAGAYFFGTSTANSPTATLNVPANSAVIAAVMAQGAPVILSGWSGLAQDQYSVNSSFGHTAASNNFVSANPSLSVTATFTSAGTAAASACFAIFAP